MWVPQGSNDWAPGVTCEDEQAVRSNILVTLVQEEDVDEEFENSSGKVIIPPPPICACSH